MSRSDIGNYLQLAPETVSRILRKLSTEGVITDNQRDMHLRDPERLEALAHPILRSDSSALIQAS